MNALSVHVTLVLTDATVTKVGPEATAGSALKITVAPPTAEPTEAPTAGSVDLAGLLLKTGIYGIFRFAFPLFPVAARLSVPLLIALGLIGVFYAAWIALA